MEPDPYARSRVSPQGLSCARRDEHMYHTTKDKSTGGTDWQITKGTMLQQSTGEIAAPYAWLLLVMGLYNNIAR